MALAPLKKCTKNGCRELVRGQARCDKCKSTKRNSTNKQHDTFSSNRRWRALRLRFLQEHPLCVKCTAAGKVKAASEVHHVKPRRTHPELAYDVANLEGLCKPCHSRETRREQGTPPRNLRFKD